MSEAGGATTVATSTAGAMNTSTAGTGGSGAATPGPNIANAGAGGGAPSTHDINPGAWMAGFSDDLKGKVGLKGFKSPVELAESYFAFEKLRGAPQERQLLLPEKFKNDDGSLTPEGRSIWERFGTPKDMKGYELEKLLPKEKGDAKLLEAFQKFAFEQGIPKEWAEGVVKFNNEYQENAYKALQEQSVQRFKDQDGALRKEWGAAYDQNVNIAKEGVRRLGHDDKTIQAISSVLGHDKTMQLYKQLGSAVGESAFVSGRPASSGAMEPATALAKIQQLKQDSGFMQRWAKGDSDAITQWTNLHKQAFPGEASLR